MKSATALTILAIGAVFAFAVTAHPSFLNLQVVGWVLMLTGITGLVIPRRGRGWLRRSVLVKGSPDFTEAPDARGSQVAVKLHFDLPHAQAVIRNLRIRMFRIWTNS